jgi:hypothetical protein
MVYKIHGVPMVKEGHKKAKEWIAWKLKINKDTTEQKKANFCDS